MAKQENISKIDHTDLAKSAIGTSPVARATCRQSRSGRDFPDVPWECGQRLEELQQQMRSRIDKTNCADGAKIQYLFELMLFPGASYYNRHLIDSCERACQKPVAELQREIARQFIEDALARNALAVCSIAAEAGDFVRNLPSMWLRELWVWLRMRKIIAGILDLSDAASADTGTPKCNPDAELGAARHFVNMTEESCNENFEGYHAAMRRIEAAGPSKIIVTLESWLTELGLKSAYDKCLDSAEWVIEFMLERGADSFDESIAIFADSSRCFCALLFEMDDARSAYDACIDTVAAKMQNASPDPDVALSVSCDSMEVALRV